MVFEAAARAASHAPCTPNFAASAAMVIRVSSHIRPLMARVGASRRSVMLSRSLQKPTASRIHARTSRNVWQECNAHGDGRTARGMARRESLFDIHDDLTMRLIPSGKWSFERRLRSTGCVGAG
jgi:hypothetical protein